MTHAEDHGLVKLYLKHVARHSLDYLPANMPRLSCRQAYCYTHRDGNKVKGCHSAEYKHNMNIDD